MCSWSKTSFSSWSSITCSKSRRLISWCFLWLWISFGNWKLKDSSEINHGKDFLDFISFMETHLANAIKLIPEVEKISEHLNRIKVNSSKSIKHKNTMSYPPNFLGKRDHEHAKIHFGIGADSNIQKLLTTRGFNTGNWQLTCSRSSQNT